MALPGIPIPETQCIGDSLATINSAFETLDTAVTAAASSGVTQIVAGSNISISPTGGTGVVTINGSASYTLPCRLGENSCTITNWNDAITNGWYMGSDATNAPGAGWYMGYVQAHNAGRTTQIIHQFAGNNSTWIREQNNSAWGSWVPYGITDVTGTAPITVTGTDVKNVSVNTASLTALLDDYFVASSGGGGSFNAPVGYVGYYAATSAPAGWVECNGAAITVAMGSTYTDLRTFLINNGSPFGVSGSDPRIPDLRGKFIRSNGSDGTYSSGTFGAKQADAFQDHSHSANYLGSGAAACASGSGISFLTPNHPSNRTGGADNSTSTETRPANVALLACIKL